VHPVARLLGHIQHRQHHTHGAVPRIGRPGFAVAPIYARPSLAMQRADRIDATATVCKERTGQLRFGMGIRTQSGYLRGLEAETVAQRL